VYRKEHVCPVSKVKLTTAQQAEMRRLKRSWA
jgi:hypothetical protein